MKLHKKEKIRKIRRKLILRNAFCSTNPEKYLQSMCDDRHVNTNGDTNTLVDRLLDVKYDELEKHSSQKYVCRKKMKDGSKYTGYVFFVENATCFPYGYGRMDLRNGDSMEGFFYNGRMYGKGVYQEKNGRTTDGNWFENVLHGPVIIRENNRIIFDGVYEFGQKSGFGKEHSQERTYEGYYKNNLPDGYGILNENGNIYNGQMKNGMKHGKGEYYENLNLFTYEYTYTSKRWPGPLQTFCNYRKTRGLWEKNQFIKDMDEQRFEFDMLSYLETRNRKKLKGYGTTQIMNFIQKKYGHVMSYQRKRRKDDVIDMLDKIHKTEITTDGSEEECYDLFGNYIKTPVTGSDGNTYDLKSMEYLFQKDSHGKFCHISYDSNEKPLFPVTDGGCALTSYYLST